MSNPTRAAILVLIALSSACGPIAETMPGDSSPATDASSASADAATPIVDSATTVPEDTAPEPPLASRPDLVSGSASRVEGTLRIHCLYRRTEADITTLFVTLFDADDRAVETLAPIAVTPNVGDTLGVAQLRLPTTPVRVTVTHVALVLEDRRGFRSVVLRMPVSEEMPRHDGSPCLFDSLVNSCDDGSDCAPSGVCTALTAPTLLSGEAFVASAPSRSALALTWNDPNGDVTSIEITTTGRCPRSLLTVAAGTLAGPWTQHWDHDVFEGVDRVRVRVRDRTDRLSNALELVVAAPRPIAAEGLCDLEATTTRCAAGTVCTRYGTFSGRSCGETRCYPDVAACPVDVATIELESPSPSTGPWIANGSLAGVDEVRASICDRDVGLAQIHHFRAPTGGAYEFALTADGDSPYVRLILRTHCSIGDAGAQTEIAVPGERRASVIRTLAAGEEVFLFASIGDRMGYTLAAAHIR